MTSELENIVDPEELEPQESEAEAEQIPAEDAGSTGEPEDTGEDEVIVSMGGEEPQHQEEEESHQAPAWVKELRKKNRELERELNKTKKALESRQDEVKPVEVGKEPELEDFDYDPEAYKKALREYLERKRQADAKLEQEKKQAEEANKRWTTRLEDYGKAKASFRVSDFEEVEAEVMANLNDTQRGMIVMVTERPEAMVYGIGKNQKLLKELASITDPAKFAYELGKREAAMSIIPRKKTAAMPESKVQGTGRSGAPDAILAKLEAEADKTGDRSKIIAYKRQLNNKTK